MKIYTKAGDKGETGLVGGKRVSKGELRLEAYGDVDELNAVLGSAAAFLEAANDIQKILTEIQTELFVAGADLATPSDYKGKRMIPQITAEKVIQLEQWIDFYDAKLSALQNFILPSGTKAGSLLHLARTVCRRAERNAVRLSKEEKINETVITYLNRLSDLLFVLARTVNAQGNSPELIWQIE